MTQGHIRLEVDHACCFEVRKKTGSLISRLSFFFLFLTLISGQSFAQGEWNHWFFGEKAGLDFNFDPPRAISKSRMISREGCAAISDPLGNLLFYTNGEVIYNRQHVIMINGGDMSGVEGSSQSALFLPKPGSDSLFYMFSVPDDGLKPGVSYSIIDLSLSMSYGNIPRDQKEMPLLYPAAEKITAISHANGRDIWVLLHEFSSRNFYSYLLTEDSLHASNPTISAVGSVHKGSSQALGYMKASLSGKKVAVAIEGANKVELFNFDNKTGKLSNPYDFGREFLNAYGLDFSPNDRFLYITSRHTNLLYQVDLLHLGESGFIREMSTNIKEIGALQLAIDGKIYIADRGLSYLSVIHQPDKMYPACEVEEEAVFLGSGKCLEGLPNIPTAVYRKAFIHAENICHTDTTLLEAKFFYLDSIQWDLGDGTIIPFTDSVFEVKHRYAEPGDYDTRLITYYSQFERYDTTYQTLTIHPLPEIELGEDFTGCDGDTLLLDGMEATNPPRSYLWNSGDTTRYHAITSTDEVWIQVEELGCYQWDTVQVVMNKNPEIEDIVITNIDICGEMTGKIEVFPKEGQQLEYEWLNKQTGEVISRESYIDQQGVGMYKLTIINEKGCDAVFDNLAIKEDQAPVLEIDIQREGVCAGDEISLSVSAEDVEEFTWHTGSKGNRLVIHPRKDTLVWVKARTSGGCVSIYDTLFTIHPLPVTGISDTSIDACLGDEIILDGGANYPYYLWQNGESRRTQLVNSSGLYWVEVHDEFSCVKRDSVDIEFHPLPEVDLGNDTTICRGEPLILDAGAGFEYFWNNFSIDQAVDVKETGIYIVSITDSLQCVNSDTIRVQINDPEDLVIDSVHIIDARCFGDRNGEIHVFARGNYDPLLYSIDGGDTFLDNMGIFQGLYASDQYLIEIKEPGACWKTGDQVEVFQPESIYLDTIVFYPGCPECNDGYIKAKALGGIPPFDYQWSNQSTDSVIVNLFPDIYQLAVRDANGCLFVQEFDLREAVEKPKIPDAFTPNADGINDLWKIDWLQDYPQAKVFIYSRRGVLIFESEPGYPDAWDGRLNGHYVSAGPYIYVIHTGDVETSRKGYVHVIR